MATRAANDIGRAATECAKMRENPEGAKKPKGKAKAKAAAATASQFGAASSIGHVLTHIADAAGSEDIHCHNKSATFDLTVPCLSTSLSSVKGWTRCGHAVRNCVDSFHASFDELRQKQRLKHT